MKKTILFLWLVASINLLSGQSQITLNLPDPCSSSNTFQNIIIPQGWSMFSTYISPDNPGIDTVLTEIESNVLIVKSGFGEIYWPVYGVNQIGDMIIGSGYQIKMDIQDTLIVSGVAVIPELTPVILPQGWSMFGYLRQSPADIDTLLGSILEISLVKNGIGQVYWPSYGVNNIGNMNPGEGYQVKMANSDTLVYLPNSMNLSKTYIKPESPVYYAKILNTGTNATIGIPLSAWDILPNKGDEIGVFDENDRLIGSCVFEGGFSAITIWGNDSYTKSQDGVNPESVFSIQLWQLPKNSENGAARFDGTVIDYTISSYSCDISNWVDKEGTPTYQENNIYLINTLTSKPIITEEYNILAMPNPFKDETILKFQIPHATNVRIEVINLLGSKMKTLVDQSFEAGIHSVLFEAKSYSEGSYYYKFITDDFTSSGIIILIR